MRVFYVTEKRLHAVQAETREEAKQKWLSMSRAEKDAALLEISEVTVWKESKPVLSERG